MMDRFWRRAPFWLAIGIAGLALFDMQFGVAGRALTIVAVVIGVVGVLTAGLADALLVGLAVALFPSDAGLLGVMLALLYRMARSESLKLDGSLRSMLLVGFFVSAAGSALFGLLAIEARPLQWFVWMATLGCPVLLLGTARPRLPDQFAPRLSRFVVFVLWLQVPVCMAQLVRHGALEPGDWFSGTWGNSNLVGLWGAVTLSVLAVRALAMPNASKGVSSWIVGGGHAVAATFLVWGASAKIYSTTVFGAAGLAIVMLVIAGGAISRVGTGLRAGAAILLLLLMGVSAESWVRDNFAGLVSNWEDSEKRTLLSRITFDIADRYNSILGVGPGMLGSRAASAASADVLFKEEEGALQRLLGPAPKPERWAMQGLWDAEVAQAIADRSALVSMPFSGWGALRGELGWPAVVLLVFYLLALGWQMSAIATRHAGACNIALAAALGCVGLLVILFFDNVLEHPHIMLPLAILVITARAVADQRHEGRIVLAGGRTAAEDLAAHSGPISTVSPGRR